MVPLARCRNLLAVEQGDLGSDAQNRSGARELQQQCAIPRAQFNQLERS